MAFWGGRVCNATSTDMAILRTWVGGDEDEAGPAGLAEGDEGGNLVTMRARCQGELVGGRIVQYSV